LHRLTLDGSTSAWMLHIPVMMFVTRVGTKCGALARQSLFPAYQAIDGGYSKLIF